MGFRGGSGGYQKIDPSQATKIDWPAGQITGRAITQPISTQLPIIRTEYHFPYNFPEKWKKRYAKLV